MKKIYLAPLSIVLLIVLLAATLTITSCGIPEQHKGEPITVTYVAKIYWDFWRGSEYYFTNVEPLYDKETRILWFRDVYEGRGFGAYKTGKGSDQYLKVGPFKDLTLALGESATYYKYEGHYLIYVVTPQN